LTHCFLGHEDYGAERLRDSPLSYIVTARNQFVKGIYADIGFFVMRVAHPKWKL